jgi:hypothetical protein
VPEACGEAVGPGLLFFRGVDEGLLCRGAGKETGDELVGELVEGKVNLGFEEGEGGRVAGELFNPALLLRGEVAADLLDGLVGGGNFGSLLRITSNTHGLSFRKSASAAPAYNSHASCERRLFLGRDPSATKPIPSSATASRSCAWPAATDLTK